MRPSFGILINFLIFAYVKKKRIFFNLTFLSFFLLVILVILGMLNKGPIGHLIYKSSIEARYYYWQAAIRMFSSNWLSGVGLDSFGDYYPEFRTKEAVLWNSQPTNSAHNIFLDYAANGGIFWFGLNFILLVLI